MAAQKAFFPAKSYEMLVGSPSIFWHASSLGISDDLIHFVNNPLETK